MEPAEFGRTRDKEDGCRRYLVHAISFDTRAFLLNDEINPEWEPQIIEQHTENRRRIRESLIHELGIADHETKIENFQALGPAPWSAVDRHNEFTAQIRVAFSSGAYYPALVGACALGERLLNELVIRLRSDFSQHPATTKEVATAASFASWITCIETLVAWEVVGEETATDFNELRKLRNRSVHYGGQLIESNARDEALRALLLVQGIVQALFSPLGGPPRFIAGTSGHSFLSLESEADPFVQHFLLPAAVLVSPNFAMVRNQHRGWFDVLDDDSYQDFYPSLTDNEFAEHRSEPRRTARPADQLE